MATSPTPAHSLVGQTLASGWTLVTKLSPAKGATGGNFGVGYVGEKKGEQSFVKAVDFVGALRSADPLKELAQLTSQANFEREALEYCGTTSTFIPPRIPHTKFPAW